MTLRAESGQRSEVRRKTRINFVRHRLELRRAVLQQDAQDRLMDGNDDCHTGVTAACVLGHPFGEDWERQAGVRLDSYRSAA